jgi:hypothetical protein
LFEVVVAVPVEEEEEEEEGGPLFKAKSSNEVDAERDRATAA